MRNTGGDFGPTFCLLMQNLEEACAKSYTRHMTCLPRTSRRLLRAELVRCPSHNVTTSDPSDNHETESVCAASDRGATKRIAQVGNIPYIAGW